jgi:hypothetical protein
MVDAKADVAKVGAHIINAVGNHLTEFLILEVVGIDPDRLTFRRIIAAGVLELPTGQAPRIKSGGRLGGMPPAEGPRVQSPTTLIE